ncbi:MAG TPA: TrgA family protein [Paenirhodobacter sp.]
MIRVAIGKRIARQPDAPRGLAALILAGTGFAAAWRVSGYVDSGGLGFGLMIAAGGAIIGWYFVGSTASVRARLARGVMGAVWTGVLLSLFMTLRIVLPAAWRGLYRGIEALATDIALRSWRHFLELAQGDVGIMLFLGGMLSAIVGNWAARRWGRATKATGGTRTGA